ncbi:autophagy-like protein 22-2 [Blastomyces silverae]|uniref:Autophagy-related protein n=1 Tax=Blastomyces silverae TaxID=2060906 RepID=A0A0H1BHQ6_9EURO|nr:autophagy-like protein 22-2 [Blastomyces silverae]
MDSDELIGHKYPGDDTRPTSKKELAGWYCYGWAAEVFTVCAMGSFLPITLEQMARDRGVLLSDKTTPCSASWKVASDLFASTASSPSGPNSPKTSQCIVYFLGMEINTASFAMYTFSVSVLIQSLLIISMSGAADHGVYRKTLLLVFAFLGAVSTMLFLGVVPQVYLLGALLAIVANTCFGASFVLLNSFLPLLVRHHPAIQSTPVSPLLDDDVQPSNTSSEPRSSQSRRPSSVSSTSPLLQRDTTMPIDGSQLKPPRMSDELQLSTRISSNGIGIGYVGAVILQIVSILIVVATGSTTFSLRLALFGIGLWWLLFTIPAAMWLRPRPGPPLPTSARDSKMWPWLSYIAFAWKSLGRTALQARHLKDVLIFLAVWFLLSDGIATVSGTAVLFAKTQLDMNLAALGLINVIAMISGTIIACICVFEFIPFYGLLGFLPWIKRLGVFGLQKPWEMYMLGAVYGLVMGGLSSYCRSFFGELIPPGFEASFYALYAITDKGSSIFGPAIVGMITDRYGEIRPAFGFLAILILIPLPLMLLIDVDRGKRDAQFLADELEERRQER